MSKEFYWYSFSLTSVGIGSGIRTTSTSHNKSSDTDKYLHVSIVIEQGIIDSGISSYEALLIQIGEG